MVKSINAITKQCSHCDIEKKIDDFFNSKSFMHKDNKTNVCKECVYHELEENPSLLLEFLAHINTPFFQKDWTKLKGNLGRYIKNFNMPNYSSKTFKDSDSEFVQFPSVTGTETGDLNNEVDDELIIKWGAGHPPERYEQFERKYNHMSKNYDHRKTAQHTENLITYCRFRVMEENASAKGEVKEAKDWGSLAKDAAQAAKLNVAQLSKSDISGGVELITQLFEAVETEAGIIPHLPRLLEQPYDDADMIIWSTINYARKLEEKPRVSYREVYNFYDDMISEYCQQTGMSQEEIVEFKKKRNNVFRDLEKIYVEPLYENGEDD